MQHIEGGGVRVSGKGARFLTEFAMLTPSISGPKL